MFKRIAVFVFSGLILLNISGCFLLLAGAAGGAGTAMWLSGKLTQQFNASYDQTIRATDKALRSLDLVIKKEAREDAVAQFRSEYTDGKEIWVDIHRITDSATRVDVRVGAISGDKTACEKILKRIQSYL